MKSPNFGLNLCKLSVFFNKKIALIFWQLSIASLLTLVIFLLFRPELTYSQNTLQRLYITQTTSEARGTVFRDHPDKAGIIIESPLTNLTFTSNMNGIVEELHQPDQGQFVLIIEPITQIITVNSPGYIQQRIRISGLAPREVRYYLAVPEEPVTNLISVIFNVQPSSAELYVNGQIFETNQTVQLPIGENQIRIERAGYQTITDLITVDERNIQFNYFMLETEDLPVLFEVNSPGATVIIDGQERGSIDASGSLGMWLFPGRYDIEIRQTGFLTKTDEIIVSEEQNNRFLYHLEKNVGELFLNFTPNDATVYINRQNYGSQQSIELAPGLYRFEIVKDEFSDNNLEINCGLRTSLHNWYNELRNDNATKTLGIPPTFTTFTRVLNSELRIKTFHLQLIGLEDLSVFVPSDFDYFFPCFNITNQ